MVFLAKNMLQLVPFRISFWRSKIELRKRTSFKIWIRCQFNHICHRRSFWTKLLNLNETKKVYSLYVCSFSMEIVSHIRPLVIDHMFCLRELPVWNLKLESSFVNPFYSKEQNHRRKRKCIQYYSMPKWNM